ncbi:MAG: urease subunit alpha, partial [Flavobacteriaceae bacterium]
YRDMFGAFGTALTETTFNFVSQASIDSGNIDKLNLKRASLPVKGCRTVGKKDMVHNTATPKIEVDPETYEVKIDGKLATNEAFTEVPMAQRYLLF